MSSLAHIITLAQTAPDPSDDVSPMMFAMLAGLAALIVGSVVALILFILTLIVHLTLAVIIWTRRPRTRILFHRGWWGMLTVFFGLFAAIPFFVLHYRITAPPRCYSCGYGAAGARRGTPCPECGTARIADFA